MAPTDQTGKLWSSLTQFAAAGWSAASATVPSHRQWWMSCWPTPCEHRRPATQGGAVWLVLQGPEQTTTYWEHTTTSDWRATSKRWPGLSRAPVVILSLASPAAYVERYGEPDKVEAGLGPVSAPDGNVVDGALPTGGGEGAWPVPYWFGDAAFATMTLLLAATDAGLGACFLGNFRGEESLLGAFDVPNTWRLFGTVLLGHPDGGDHRSPSLDRPGPPLSARIHRATWNADVGS